MTAYGTTQNGLTHATHLLLKELHCTFQRKGKQRTKMQEHKDILVAVPKSIYNNLLYGIAIGQTVQSSSKAPST
jgi:hypothetical protein